MRSDYTVRDSQIGYMYSEVGGDLADGRPFFIEVDAGEWYVCVGPHGAAWDDTGFVDDPQYQIAESSGDKSTWVWAESWADVQALLDRYLPLPDEEPTG